MTMREALQSAAAALEREPALRDRALPDARQLVEVATGLSRAAMLARPEATLSAQEQHTLAALLQRRLRSEPIQYLRGSQEFYGRDFTVSAAVLIPRPETEDLVTAVLEAVPDRAAPLQILDIGTGSGALAVTLALELPRAEVTAVDISAAALAVARGNAQALGAADRVHFQESDLDAALDPAERFDVVVSNPPYIPLGDAPGLHAEVRDYEPHTALFAGEDGHDLYRRLVPRAYARLRSGGLLLLETGGRVDLLLHWLREGWHAVHTRPDLQGIPRVVSARRI